MEEIYANIDYLKSVQPDPQAPRQGEPGQPDGDLNHCCLSSVLILSAFRLPELREQPELVPSSLSGPAESGSADRTRGRRRLP